MTAYISDELFHFVGRAHPDDHESNFATLCSILEGGTISYWPHDKTWGHPSYRVDLSGLVHSETLISPNITCYCDIPREALPIHMRKYGEFGLSLSRHYLSKYGARPVTYIPMRRDDRTGANSGTNVLAALESTYRGLVSQLLPTTGDRSGGSYPTQEPDSPEDAIRHLQRTLELDVLAFVKPFNSMLDDDDENYYYAEREWRRLGNMKFSPEDVLGVVVHRDYLERAKEMLPAYSEKIWTRQA